VAISWRIGRATVGVAAVLAISCILAPMSSQDVGAATQNLSPSSPAIVSAIAAACTTGVFTEPSAPGIPASLVGRSISVTGCSQYAPASAIINGSATASPNTTVLSGYCTSGSGGFDDSGTLETGYTLQNCSTSVDLLQATNIDSFRFIGTSKWYGMCSDNFTQYLVSANDSFCDDSGIEDTYWRVEGSSEIVLPPGYLWVTVQPGCTGVLTETEFCGPTASGFTEYWNWNV
jgi:hypothetical protein